MATRQRRKSGDLSRNPGMTPIDNPAPDLSDETHEPDETTGRLPTQDRDRTTVTTTENRRPSEGTIKRNGTAKANDTSKTRQRR